MRREVAEYDRIPRGYGVAYRELSRLVAVCYPVPLNWVVRWARAFWWRLAIPRKAMRLEQLTSRARFAGYQAGYEAAQRETTTRLGTVFDAGYSASGTAMEMLLDKATDEQVRQRVDEIRATVTTP